MSHDATTGMNPVAPRRVAPEGEAAPIHVEVRVARNEVADALLEPWLRPVEHSTIDAAAVARVTETLADADPEGILAIDPSVRDEYRREAEMVVALASVGALTTETLWAVFASQFGGESRFGARHSTAWPYLLSWIAVDLDE